jgi:CRP/FNR family cyclic AMP-dependent transcriptional regulator
MDAESLKTVPLFASLSDDNRDELATWVSELTVSEGKHLVDQGDYSYDLFIIEEGTAEVLQDGEHVTDLGPGDFFGEMGVLARSQRNATVIAKSPMRLLTLSSWDVKRVRSAAPQVLDQLAKAIEERSPSD